MVEAARAFERALRDRPSQPVVLGHVRFPFVFKRIRLTQKVVDTHFKFMLKFISW
jgi:hypothetical protein